MSTVPQSEPELVTLTEDFGSSASLIFDRAFVLYGTLDQQGHILNLRGSIFDETSGKPSLLVRQPFAETVFWQTSEANVRLIEAAIQSAIAGEASSLVLDFRLNADDKRALELCFQPLEGEEKRIFVFGRPRERESGSVNEYKRESDQLLLAAEYADLGLWYWDHVAERLYSTPRCNEIFGLAAYEELNYDKVLAVVHPDDRSFVEQFFDETRRTGSRYEEEFRVIYPDGRIEWICSEGKSFLDPDGRPERMVGVVQTITEAKVKAAELERVYEREKKARDEAEEANRTKDFFLNFVSHELRSPLNAIQGYAKILLRGEVSDETRRKAYETIDKSARIQTKLINDIVDSTRVASGKIKLEYRPVNIVEVIRAAFEAQRPTAESQGLKFLFETDKDQVVVFGDPSRLQQVFANLLSNAIKFTPDGGEVIVVVASHEGSVDISVSDTGLGVDPQALPNIFKQYAQGDAARARRGGGLGLGLSIVNILVTRHGGQVKAESAGAGLGAKFTVTLPLNANAQDIDVSEAPNPKESAKRLKGFNILIVEDDPDSREVLQIFLEQSGAAVRAAESAKAAMSIFNDSKLPPPDVLISDLAMPEEDGYSLMARIRELPPEMGGQVPAMALSAFASAESRQRAFEAGFHRYLTKPFEPELIVDQVVALRELNGGEPTPSN